MKIEEKASELIKILIEKDMKISIAESLTGGMISSKLCDIGGASKVFLEGIVCYNENSKIKRLGVNPADIEKYSTVSEQVVIQMAEGVRGFLNTDIGIATTGVAGPDDFDCYGNPKGLFYIAVSTKEKTEVLKFNEVGNRDEIRKKASLYSIEKCLEVIKAV